MLSENNYFLFLLIFMTFGPLMAGLIGVVKRESVTISAFYMSINLLISGILMCFVLILYLFYRNHFGWIGNIRINTFYLFISGIFGMIFFVAGLNGVLNRKKIDNEGFYKASKQLLILSLIVFSGLILWWIRWGNFK